MTPIEEQIKLLQAVLDGKTLQCASIIDPTNWKDANPTWYDAVKRGNQSIDVACYNWRIKPEPKVIWVNEYQDGYAVGYSSECTAIKAAAASQFRRVAVKYQEVQ